jgi:hypothetical protein
VIPLLKVCSLVFIKGTCHEIFDLWFFSSINSILAPDTRVKAFLHMASHWSAVSLTPPTSG